MASSAIPKPQFKSCDETSLKLIIQYSVPQGSRLFLQYKEPHADWAAAGEVNVRGESVDVNDVVDAVDLKPGTPYFVRLAEEDENGNRQFGPETVFDTKPIDCTPKKKKCIIS